MCRQWLRRACAVVAGLVLAGLAPPTGSVDTFVRAGANFDAAQHPGRPLYEANCAACHEGGNPKAPHREFLQAMSPETVLAALETGVMRQQAASLTSRQRRQVAEYVTRTALSGRTSPPQLVMCADGARGFALDRPLLQVGWGYDNRRFVGAPGLVAAQVPALKLRWAFAFPNALRARSQPVIAMGSVFVGSQDGTIYAFDLATGCARWTSRVSAEVRTAIVVEPWRAGVPNPRPRLFFGDLLGRVHAMDALSGRLLWSVRAGDHANATITGTPALHGDTLYVPISSLEVVTATATDYACCTFRGSVVALAVHDGAEKWRTYTVPQGAEVGRSAAGASILAPSGAPVWNSPTVDAGRGLLYFGSGENYSSPADGNSDAVFAVDLATGRRRWRVQLHAGDAWNGACMLKDHPNCPAENGPDHDVAASPVLVDLGDRRAALVAVSKSGLMVALDPETGRQLWRRQVGRGSIQGGVHFGLAAQGTRLYAPIADSTLKADGSHYPDKGEPGLHALDAKSGRTEWYMPAPPDRCGERPFCDAGISAAATAIPNVVFAGHLDGWLRAYDGASGRVLWETDTACTFTAVNGVVARGGSISGPGPAIGEGFVVVNSGYGFSNHMPGNALLVFAPAQANTR